MEIIGKQIALGLAVEATKGTAPSTPAMWTKNVSANILERAENANDESVLGVMEDGVGVRTVKKFIEGSYESNLFANAFGYLAYNIYGEVSSALVETGVYDHTFSISNSSIFPSLAFYAKDGDVQQLALQDCHLNTLEINANTDDYVKITSNIIGKNAVDNSAEVSYEEDYDFIGKEIVIKIADTEAGLAGASPICIKEFNVTYDKGLLSDYCLGNYNPNLYASKVSIEGSFVKNFADETFKDMFLNNTAKYMSITITGEATIGATSKPTITLVFNKVLVTAWDRSGGKDDLVTEDISFKAFYNTTDSEASSLKIRNTIESYEIETSA